MKRGENIFIWYFIKFNRHKVSIHAAQVSFFMLVSVFPFLMFLITLLQYTPIDEAMILSAIRSFVPGEMSDLVSSWVRETYAASSGTILSITVISALWASSKGVSSITYALDNIYETEKHRKWLIRRFFSLLYMLIFTIMLAISLTVLVYGNQILQMLGHYFILPSEIAWIMFLLRSAVSFLIFVFFFLCIYRFIPNHRSTFREELPGAGFSAFLWIAFSYLYSVYVDSFGRFTPIYGSLTYIVLLILWLYICIMILFMGAMLNKFLNEHGHLYLLSSLREIKAIAKSYVENKI